MSTRTLTKEIVTKTAYMIGVPMEQMEYYYGDECGSIIDELNNNDSAKIIRTLCTVRTIIMHSFSAVDGALRYDLKNIDRMPQFPIDDIKWLTRKGVAVSACMK